MVLSLNLNKLSEHRVHPHSPDAEVSKKATDQKRPKSQNFVSPKEVVFLAAVVRPEPVFNAFLIHQVLKQEHPCLQQGPDTQQGEVPPKEVPAAAVVKDISIVESPLGFELAAEFRKRVEGEPD